MDNKIARLLYVVGILTIVIGGIFGVFLMYQSITGVMFLISALVSGIFVLGFSEVIKLLHEIRKKLGE